MKNFYPIALGVLMILFSSLLDVKAQYVQKSDLPAIYVETVNSQPILSKEEYVSATLHYVDENGVKTYENMEIRGRGNSTWGLAKKPFRIKFASKEKFMGDDRANAKSWVLLANYADKTLIRNAVASYIGSFVGQPFTAGAQFVDLILNGEFLGNYQLSDQMEVRKKRVDIDEQDEVPAEDTDISGGYFLEVDGFATAEPCYYRTNRNILVTIKSPDEDIIVDRQVQYIKNHMQRFEDALFSENFTDKDTGYRQYVDSLTLASWYISTELTGNVDGFWSTYMYKKKGDDKFYWGPLWDYDIAFNNCNRVGDVSQRLMTNAGFGDDLTKVWMLQMWRDPWFVRLINRTWKECVERGIETHVLNYIDSMAQVVNRSQAMNFSKWPINQRVYNEIVLYSTYQEGIDYLKNFISKHCAFLTRTFQAAEDEMGPIEVPTPEFVLDDTYYYHIINDGSTNMLDIDDNGTNLVCTWAASHNRDTQLWEIVKIGDYYQIINYATGMALQDMATNNKGEYVAGSQLEQAPLQATNYLQHWKFVPINNGNNYIIENRQTGLALNNSGGGVANGTSVISWLNNSDNAVKGTRQWHIEKDTPKDILGPSAVKEVKHETEYLVLLDPETKRLHFEASDREALKGTAEIFAANGTKVMQFNVAEDAILKHLPQGVYILSWKEGDTPHSVKFLLK